MAINVLLVEDNPSDVVFVKRRLQKAQWLRVEIDVAEWLSTALTALQNKSYSLVLLDLSLPDSHGIDTVVAVRRAAPNTPIIVLSGQEDLAIAAKAMEAGADSFAVKRAEMSTEELEREILYSLERTRRANTSRELMQRSLERLSIDSKPDAPAPAVSGLVAVHVNKVEESINHLRLFLQRNYPAAATHVEEILNNDGFFVALNELRSLLHMDESIHTRRTRRISDRAVEAVREATAEASPIVDPERDLLDVISKMDRVSKP